MRSTSVFSSLNVCISPYPMLASFSKLFTFLISVCSCSMRLSRCFSILNRSDSSSESRRAESDNVGEGGALIVISLAVLISACFSAAAHLMADDRVCPESNCL